MVPVTRKNIDELNIPEKYKLVANKTSESALSLNLDYLNKINLFGSCAREQVRYGSDVDLMYITDYDLQNSKERSLLYNTNFIDENNCRLPEVDIVLYTEQILRSGSMPFTKSVNQEGIIVWERS